MKTETKFLLGLLIAYIILGILFLKPEILDTNYFYTECPPGYYLEVNDNGEYRPCRVRNNEPVFWYKEKGSKKEALSKAWKVYKYKEEYKKANTWRRVGPVSYSQDSIKIHQSGLYDSPKDSLFVSFTEEDSIIIYRPGLYRITTDTIYYIDGEK